MAKSSSATHGAAGDPIVGREQELARLERLINGVSERGAALLVRGEPGIGKPTLLAAAHALRGPAREPQRHFEARLREGKIEVHSP